MSRFAVKKTSPLDPEFVDDAYQAGFADSTQSYAYVAKPGLSEGVVRHISYIKEEPAWMLEKRLSGFVQFAAKSLPPWGGDLSGIQFDQFHYYLRPTDKTNLKWDDVPPDIKQTFIKLGIPQAEREFLAGAKMQYDSEVVYGSLKSVWQKQGVIFLSMDEGLRQHPDLVKQYFGTLIDC
jgi:Fe-S cluster assembly protein SufB